MNKNALAAINMLIIMLSVIQGLLPTSPIHGQLLVWFSALLILASAVLTGLQQFYNSEINNKSIYQTASLFAVAVLGAINHFTQTVPIPEIYEQWLRFGLTASIAVVNTYSQTFFPAQSNTDIKP